MERDAESRARVVMAMHEIPPVLCQPDARKSCGACCGLYNYRGGTRENLVRRLQRRTEAFRALGPATVDSVTAFAARVRDREDGRKLLETIHNCEFLGFLDPGCRRVGCLLHPAQNRGKDLRACSFYGAELCGCHLCLSHQKLTAAEKACVIGSTDDWYLYGICITDIDLCKSFFRFASDLLGEEPPLSVLQDDDVRRAARDFFSLKVNWAFRGGEEGRFGKYCLAEDEYREARIPYEDLGVSGSPCDAVFLSLESRFANLRELREAEGLIGRRVEAFVRACRESAGKGRGP